MEALARAAPQTYACSMDAYTELAVKITQLLRSGVTKEEMESVLAFLQLTLNTGDLEAEVS